MVQKYRGSVAAWAAALLFAALLDGQTTGTGTMVGTVTDTSGAVVAGAKVTVVNTATAFTSEITTGGEGAYYIPYLAPGTYRLSAEMGDSRSRCATALSYVPAKCRALIFRWK